jgi:hypothetical protein
MSQQLSNPPLSIITISNIVDAILTVGLITFITTFTLFYSLHKRKSEHEFGAKQIPTISLTGSYLPGDIIFTYSLHVISILNCLLFTLIYYTYDNKMISGLHESLIENNSKVKYWNKICWLLGIFGSVLLSITGSISLTTNTAVHGTVAFFMFISYLLYNIFFYNKISKLGFHCDNTSLYQQQFAVIMGIPFVILVYIIAGIVFSLCDNYTCTSFVVNVHVALEYWITFTLAVFIFSFRNESTSFTVLLSSRNGNAGNSNFKL